MKKIKAMFSNLTPQKKRIVILVIGVGILGFLLYLVVGQPPATTSKARQNDVVRSVLTDRDTRNMSVESLAADLKNTQQRIIEQNQTINRLQNDVKRAQDQSQGVAPAVTNEITRILQKQDDIQHQIDSIRKDGVGSGGGGSPVNVFETPASTPDSGSVPSESSGSTSLVDQELGSLSDVFSSTEVDDMTQQGDVNITPTNRNKEALQTTEPQFTIKTHTQVVPEVDEKALEDAKAKKEMLYIPAGSIITATFINGLDAPTGQGARRDPFPATLRVQHEAILPNHFRADIRECFLIVSGYGELSSERAYLRGETLSCVRSDGGVIESRLESYAVGEDGKAGVRGRLVSKQGQMIARALMAGFLSGMSEAFDVDPVPIIATQNTGRTQFQDRGNFSSDFLKSATAKGASNAMEKIADYYIQMAEGIFPVIEIVSGRQIDVIMTRGAELRIKNK